MTVRLPKNLSNTLSFKSGAIKTGASVLEAELLGEKAYSLGLAARSMQKSLQKLASFTGSEVERKDSLQSSAYLVHAYFVQREMLGFSNHDHPIEHYNIPNEVLCLIGIKKPVV